MGFKQYLEESKVEPKEYSKKELKAREKKKSDAVKTLQKNISKLKSKISSDLSSSDEKTKLTALVIHIMLITSERVGNFNSANGIRQNEDGKLEGGGEKHYGVTGLRNKHVTFGEDGVVLSYIGKSATPHKKVIKDKKVVSLLKELKKNNKDFLFTTKEGQTIKPEKVNDYLKDFDVTAKDIRTYNINKMVLDALKGNIPNDEKERKKKFLEVIKKIAGEIEHGETQTRNNYLNSVVEPNYVEKGKVVDINMF